MAAKSYVYLVRLGDAAFRAYTSKRELLEFLRNQDAHMLQRYYVQRLEIGHVEQGLEIKLAADVLALWEMARGVKGAE